MSNGYAVNTKIVLDSNLRSAENRGGPAIYVKVLRKTASMPCRLAAFVCNDKEPVLVARVDASRLPSFAQFASLAKQAAYKAGFENGYLVQSGTPGITVLAEKYTAAMHPGYRFRFVTTDNLIPV